MSIRAVGRRSPPSVWAGGETSPAIGRGSLYAEDPVESNVLFDRGSGCLRSPMPASATRVPEDFAERRSSASPIDTVRLLRRSGRRDDRWLAGTRSGVAAMTSRHHRQPRQMKGLSSRGTPVQPRARRPSGLHGGFAAGRLIKRSFIPTRCRGCGPCNIPAGSANAWKASAPVPQPLSCRCRQGEKDFTGRTGRS